MSAQFIDLNGIGEGDSTSIMKKMKFLEDQYLETNSSLIEQLKYSTNVKGQTKPLNSLKLGVTDEAK